MATTIFSTMMRSRQSVSLTLLNKIQNGASIQLQIRRFSSKKAPEDPLSKEPLVLLSTIDNITTITMNNPKVSDDNVKRCPHYAVRASYVIRAINIFMFLS